MAGAGCTGGRTTPALASLRYRSFPWQTIERHDFAAELVVPDPGPVLDYVASMRVTQGLADPGALVAAAAGLLAARGDGPIRIRTRSGCLVAR
jgi:hypothetical protein